MMPCCDVCGSAALKDHCERYTSTSKPCGWKRCICGAYGIPGKWMFKLESK